MPFSVTDSWQEFERIDRLIAKHDLLRFGQRYIPPWFEYPFGQFHDDFARKLLDPSKTFLCWMPPRYHGKTTIGTQLYPTHAIAHDRQKRILLISETEKMAIRSVRVVGSVLFGNRKLIRDYGRFKPQDSASWAKNEFIVSRFEFDDAEYGGDIEKDPTYIGVGLFGANIGRRADIVIFDDIFSKQKCKTAAQRTNIKDWIEQVIWPILPPWGKKIFMGTVQNAHDYLFETLRENAECEHVILDAIPDGMAISDEREPRETLWPGFWDWPTLMMHRREVGAVSFDHSMRNIPSSEVESLFPLKWLRQGFQDGDNLPAKIITRKIKEPHRLVVLAADFSVVDDPRKAQETDSDYCCIGAFEFIPTILRCARCGMDLGHVSQGHIACQDCGDVVNIIDGDRQLLYLWRERGLSFRQQCHQLRRLGVAFKPKVLIMDATLFQRIYEQTMIETTDLPVVGYPSAPGKALWDAVPSLSVIAEKGRLLIPRGDAESKKMTEPFVQELNGLGREAHDDTVAVWFLAEEAFKNLIRWRQHKPSPRSPSDKHKPMITHSELDTFQREMGDW